MRTDDQRTAPMIRIDEAWLSSEAMDMRAGMDTLLARVVLIFGAAQPQFITQALFLGLNH